MVKGPELEAGSDTGSPCSSRYNSAAADTQHASSNSRGSHHSGTQGCPPPGSDGCSLRHVAAPAGHNSPRTGETDTGHTSSTAADARGKPRHQQQVVDHHTPADDEKDLSEDVLAGIKAVEDYFSGNPEAAQQLLQDFLAQRRQRLASAGRNAEGPVALPQLFGRRHHYAVAVKVVPRKPGRR